MQSRDLDVRYKDEAVKVTMSYKYLGYVLDPFLTLRKDFEDAYKRASNRLRLLARLRDQLTSEIAYKIYEMMIVPILTYSGTVKLLFTNTQLERLTSIERRAKEIIGSEREIPSLDKLIKMKSSLVVRKCFDNEICSISVDISKRTNMIEIQEIRLYLYDCLRLNLNTIDILLDLQEPRFIMSSW